MGRWKGGRKDGWMDEWMDGWMGGREEGWKGGRMEGSYQVLNGSLALELYEFPVTLFGWGWGGAF